MASFLKLFFPLFCFFVFTMEKSVCFFCVCGERGGHGPPVPHSLVLLALLSVIFNYCFRNWDGIGLLDCGPPLRGSWWVGVFRLSWSWSLVACKGCWDLLVILVYYFLNTKIRNHLKKSCWEPWWGCVKVSILLFSYRHLCDSIFLHSTGNAQLVDMMWSYFWL